MYRQLSWHALCHVWRASFHVGSSHFSLPVEQKTPQLVDWMLSMIAAELQANKMIRGGSGSGSGSIGPNGGESKQPSASAAQNTVNYWVEAIAKELKAQKQGVAAPK